jgi:hypothetical protein
MPDKPFDIVEAKKGRQKDQEKMRKNAGGIAGHKAFSLGDNILFRGPKKGSEFRSKGVVISVRDSGKSYQIKTESGKVKIRNNCYLRLAPAEDEEETVQAVQDVTHVTHGYAVTRATFSLAPESQRDHVRRTRCVVTSRQAH